MLSRVVRAVAPVVIASMCVVACNKSPTKPSDNASLTAATTLTQFANRVKSDYNYNIDAFLPYDHGFGDFPNARTLIGTDDPLAGTFLAYPAASYPTANGRVIVGAAGTARKVTYSGVDLTNGLTIEGQYQAFWGIKDVAVANGFQHVPFVIVTEGIVTRNGMPKYRALQVLQGEMYKGKGPLAALNVSSSTIVLAGSYTALNLQTIDTTDPAVPCVLSACAVQYSAVWIKQ